MGRCKVHGRERFRSHAEVPPANRQPVSIPGAYSSAFLRRSAYVTCEEPHASLFPRQRLHGMAGDNVSFFAKAYLV